MNKITTLNSLSGDLIIINQLNDLVIPLIHLNGSGGENLTNELSEVYNALHEALRLMENLTVHPRDFYPLYDSANLIQKAQGQKNRRILVLKHLIAEIGVLQFSIKQRSIVPLT